MKGGKVTGETEGGGGRRRVRNRSRQRGEAERGEGAKHCARQRVFLAELPEALHIPARLIEAVSVFVFSARELPPDYRETAVHPLPPDSALCDYASSDNQDKQWSCSGEAFTPF